MHSISVCHHSSVVLGSASCADSFGHRLQVLCTLSIQLLIHLPQVSLLLLLLLLLLGRTCMVLSSSSRLDTAGPVARRFMRSMGSYSSTFW
jgi:hypothetical protein